MNIVEGAARLVTGTATAATAAAGAVGGAAVNGIVGGVQGAANGIRDGLSSGSHSTPAALLTLGAVGAAGLVEWPVLAAVGGTALLARQLGRTADAEAAPAQAPDGPSSAPRKSTARKKTVTGRG
ncbi:hypothetical protein NIIDNTM18_13280 [Mycolicibacterium litorale]|uniref:Transmembrane protein n=1 Tax=Mycolicibacterium litorale TaxID=758802 RepID=A0A6S6P5V2_9MYCO|nr:hypothetical protein [Mycolicibacterium litorale]BCI52050.1 hypothetical protein NIIDNTM18_13280 [Mycolicibacterium litorale]